MIGSTDKDGRDIIMSTIPEVHVWGHRCLRIAATIQGECDMGVIL